jgi:hypothetical protein
MNKEDFKNWWYHEGSQAPYTHHDCEEHCMRMCEIAWSNGAFKEREACAKICDEHSGYMTGIVGLKIRARGLS